MLKTTTLEDGQYLVEWLNGPGRKPYRQWLKALHEKCDLHPRHRQMQSLTTAAQDEEARQRMSALLEEFKELEKLKDSDWSRFKQLGDRINSKLSRYHFMPWLGLDQWMSWVPKKPIKDPAQIRTAPAVRIPLNKGHYFWATKPSQGKTPAQESYALQIIESIVRAGDLESIRRCKFCARWFILTKPWGTSCRSPVCQAALKRAYQISDDYKANRRKSYGEGKK